MREGVKYRPPDFLKEELYMEHATRNFHAHGGNEWVVGGKLTILEGATVTGITATAAAASGTTLGGVKAAAKSAQDTVEVKIGADCK